MRGVPTGDVIALTSELPSWNARTNLAAILICFEPIFALHTQMTERRASHTKSVITAVTGINTVTVQPVIIIVED